MGDGRPPEDSMHTAPDSHAVHGARLTDGRMNEEADSDATRREAAGSPGGAVEYRREGKMEDQPTTPTVDAATVQQEAKGDIMPVMSPLIRLTP